MSMSNSIACVNFNLDFLKINILSTLFPDSGNNFYEMIFKLGRHKIDSIFKKFGRFRTFSKAFKNKMLKLMYFNNCDKKSVKAWNLCLSVGLEVMSEVKLMMVLQCNGT